MGNPGSSSPEEVAISHKGISQNMSCEPRPLKFKVFASAHAGKIQDIEIENFPSDLELEGWWL